MNSIGSRWGARQVGVFVVVIVAAAISWWYLNSRDTWPRGQALTEALGHVIENTETYQAIVARVISTNYLEIRANASRWSGDFQRKWQANRIAAAQVERIGYAFLQADGRNARSFPSVGGKTLHQRHVAIVGGTEGDVLPGQEQGQVTQP